MSKAGFRARIYAVEWHANLWRLHGTPVAQCEAMLQHCSQCVEADYYGLPRPDPPDDPHVVKMQAYLDDLFATHDGCLISFT